MKKLFSKHETLLLVSFLLSACQGEDSNPKPEADLNLQEKVSLLCSDTTEQESNCSTFSEELLTSIENHNYLTTDFTKAHKNNGYPSVVSLGKNIAVYVSNDGAEDFLQVDPDIQGSNIEVGIGTTIIREVWDEASLAKYTAMIKMEAGYFPEGGDFSYIEIATDGSIISGGKNPACAECHLARNLDGFLFGVEAQFRIDNNSTGPTPEDIENRMMRLAREALENDAYLDNQFTQVNQEAFPSALNGQNFIDVYVSDFGYSEYIKANPDSDAATAIDLPEDTVIVRTVKNTAGELTKYTVMVKAPAGYYPNGGDFYYGEFDTDRQVIEVDGIANEGALTACGGCHNAQRRDMAFLFGVSPNYQTPGASDNDLAAAELEMMSLARAALEDLFFIRSNEFKKVNRLPFTSALNDENYIDVYVSAFAYDEYIKADPDSDLPVNIDFPENAVIVRTVSNFAGELSKFTVMVKGPTGYYPDGGDFYFGEFDIDGEVIEVNGAPSEGALTACGGCHDIQRSDMAYLFGVSPADR